MDQLNKKDRRLERKKRKAEAFLRLAEENDMDRKAKRKKVDEHECTTSEDSSSENDNESHTRGNRRTETDKVNETDPIECTRSNKTQHGQSESQKGQNTNEELESAEEKVKALRAAIIARRKLSMERPKLFMRSEFASLNIASTEEGSPAEEMPPLFVIDIQHVLLFAIQGNLASFKPRFCTLLRCGRVSQAIIIVLNGLTHEDYMENQDCFSFLSSSFEIKVPLVSPTQYGSTLEDELFNVPLSATQIKNARIRKSRDEKKAKKKDLRQVCQEVREIKFGELEDTEIGPLNKVDLLLSPTQMIHESYPLPAHQGQYKGYICTKDMYKRVKSDSPMFAIDCEMVQTTVNSHELAWIAVVNEHLEVVYESLVKPCNPITNYLTRYSGITRQRLQDVTKRLEDVQKDLRSILPADAILCGQSFWSDLKAMRMFHPYVIDTSVIFNLSGIRHMKTGLRRLAEEFLGEEIQRGGDKGHSPVEDSITTMKLVQHKLSHGDVCYGDIILYNTPVPIGIKPSRQQEKEKEEILSTQQEEAKVEISSNQEENVKDQSSSRQIENVKEESSEEEGSDSKNLFFRRPGTKLTESLFGITKGLKKSVLYVDKEENAQSYKEDVDEVHMTCTDKESVKMVCGNMVSHRVCYVQLHGGAGMTKDIEEDSKKNILKKLDKRIKKLVSSVEDKSIVAVFFPGRSEGETSYDALGCLQISGLKPS